MNGTKQAFFKMIVCCMCFQVTVAAGQTTNYNRRIYQEKTPGIKMEVDPTFGFHDITLLSLIEYRMYTDYRTEEALYDSSFYAKRAHNAANYYDGLETSNKAYKSFRWNDSLLRHICFKTNIFLNHYCSHSIVQFPEHSKQESAALIAAFRQIEDKLRDSIVIALSISDTLYAHLKKYATDVIVVQDIQMYNNRYSVPRRTNSFALLRLYVIDMRNNGRVLWYDYKTAYDHHMVNSKASNAFPDFRARHKKLRKSLKRFLKSVKKAQKHSL